MTRLADRFAHVAAAGEKALVCYTMAGDPSLDRTVDLVPALAQAGADIVELGMPFSDPLADGPVIQAAAMRSLCGGTSAAAVLDTVQRIRERTDVPIVLMTYYNPVLRYGPERFARDAAGAGVDGTIVVDLTPEEAGPWLAASQECGLDSILLVAPTTTDERLSMLAGRSTGFVYCVSRTGTTGARQGMPPDLPALVERIRPHARVPVCVGFGISTAEHVRQVCAFADGAVVGSALVDLVGREGDTPLLTARAARLVRDLKRSTLPVA